MLVVEGWALIYLAYCYFKASAKGREYSHSLGAITAVFVFFALFFDAIGFRISHQHQLIEEPAELFVITLILVWVHKKFHQISQSTE